jgi:hypothetical protein
MENGTWRSLSEQVKTSRLFAQAGPRGDCEPYRINSEEFTAGKPNSEDGQKVPVEV